MSGKTKIKFDSHGLYIRTNGSVYRPYRSMYGYMIKAQNGTSSFVLGDGVTVSHITGTPHCRVKQRITAGDPPRIEEIWSSHGEYIGANGYPTKDIKSDDCWRPK